MTQEQEAPKRVPVEKNRGGTWVQFGDELYRVPPLSFMSVIELQTDVDGLQDMTGGRPTPEQMSVVSKIVHAALARNYPSLSIADIASMVDLGNYEEVLGAVLNIGGFKKGPSSGEPVAAATGMPLTSASPGNLAIPGST